MNKRQAKKVWRRYLRGTPYDKAGRPLPPYHSLVRYRKTTHRRARRIVGRLEERYWMKDKRWKWNPYDFSPIRFAHVCFDDDIIGNDALWNELTAGEDVP